MVQIGKLYPRLCELGTEVLLVAPTRPEHARLYLGRFAVPYPYLCDPDYQVRRAWGLEVRRSAGAYLRMFRAGRTLQRANVPEPDDVAIRPGWTTRPRQPFATRPQPKTRRAPRPEP